VRPFSWDPYETNLVRSFHDIQEQQRCIFEPGHYTSIVEVPAHFLGPTSYELVVRATIHEVRACSFPRGVIFPVHVVYHKGWCGPYDHDTFRAKLNPLLDWNTSNTGSMPSSGRTEI